MSQTSERYFAEDLAIPGKRVAIVSARFNLDITDALLGAARQELMRLGVDSERIDVYRVPGAFELPGAVARILASGRHDAIIALGCVIRGGTPHFEYVAGEAARGLAELSRTAAVPVIFGVLTTDDEEQARARAGGSEGNKGQDAARAAAEMVRLYDRIEEAP